MIRTLYNIGVLVYDLGLSFAALWHRKARARKHGTSTGLHNDLTHIMSLSPKRILIHCASLGEYEQAKPLVRMVVAKTDYDIVLSFYSPSGYRDCVLESPRVKKCYLPNDRKSKMSRFIREIQPKKVIIIKNEWWWNMLLLLKSKSIPTYLISATFRRDHYFIRRPAALFKDGLSAFDTIFTSNKQSKSILSRIHDGRIIVAGDTRSDQVRTNMERTKLASKRELSTIIYGSAWQSDIPVIVRMIDHYPHYRHIIYPHDLTSENIDAISSKTNGTRIKNIEGADQDQIYINTSMGQLKYDFSQADIAYIGGGFGVGIHNVLEAAVFEIPVLFGPNYNKSAEAQDLLGLDAAYCIPSTQSADAIFESIDNPEKTDEIKLKLKSYFSALKSPTKMIFSHIFQ